MDAQDWVESHSRFSSMKRSWRDDHVVLNPRADAWNGAILPPIESNLIHQHSPSALTAENTTLRRPSWLLDPSNNSTKRVKIEGDGYNLALPGFTQATSAQQTKSHSPKSSHRGSLDLSGFQIVSQRQARDWEKGSGEVGPAASPSTQPRCRRLTTHPNDLDPNHQGGQEACQETSADSDVMLVAQAAATELTKALNTLSSGIASTQRGASRRESVELLDSDRSDLPSIGQRDLVQTLDWILRRTSLVNDLAERLVHQIRSASPRPSAKVPTWQDSGCRNDEHDSMKRHLNAGLDDGEELIDDHGEEISDSRPYTRRKSAITFSNTEDLPSLRSHTEYHPFQLPADGSSRRHSIMNPPPAPTRHLPSSPGRSLPSPTSVNFPSPSAASYGSSSQSVNLPPHGLLTSSNTPYLPSITSQSSDSALQAHTAALQHEVSVQKIALSSLQGEHDKLLAAFSRSQTRASALEKKHSVSDNEIINLSEEKMRLQNQVTDLEKDVEDLTRSRDEARQSAVQEAAQYVEIVKKATQLEAMAAGERKNWNRLKSEMEERITALTKQSDLFREATMINERPNTPGSTDRDRMEILPAAVGQGLDSNLGSAAPSSTVVGLPQTAYPSMVEADPSEVLRLEVIRLRARCAEMEGTLKAVREENMSVEGIVRALGAAGKSILDKVDKALENSQATG